MNEMQEELVIGNAEMGIQFEKINLLMNKSGIQRLTSLVTLGGIQIYGGEPLLYTELSCIITISHNIVPDAELRLFTNGLLLRSMPETLMVVLREHNIKVIWSVYPVFDDEAFVATCKFLQTAGLAYQAERTDKFYASATGGLHRTGVFICTLLSCDAGRKDQFVSSTYGGEDYDEIWFL